MSRLEILTPGPRALIEDRGRFGWSHVGVGRSGAADMPSHDASNRLVGNSIHAATIEITVGGFSARTHGDVFVAVTGAAASVSVDGVPVGERVGVAVPSGALLRVDGIGPDIRMYLAVRGGFSAEPVLGSRSTDTLAGLGPPALAAGDHVLVGVMADEWPAADQNPFAFDLGDPVQVSVIPGPRLDWFAPGSLDRLCDRVWTVTDQTDRVGMRLTGSSALKRGRSGELPSEGMVPGALQVPPNGEPVLFLADHPVTGGYPVIAVVTTPDIAKAAQCGPGRRIRFRVGSPVDRM